VRDYLTATLFIIKTTLCRSCDLFS